MKNGGQHWKQGFSLVELLVVVGIMGLLFAILVPAIGAVRRSASRAEAGQMVRAIDSAMIAYHAEYGRFPLQYSDSGTKRYRIDHNIDDQPATTFSEYNELIRILASRPRSNLTSYPSANLGVNITSEATWFAAHNPRRIQFLDIQVITVTDYLVDTIVEDPWGNHYRIAADWSMQRNVNTGARKQSQNDHSNDGHGWLTNRAVAVWSLGSEVGRPQRYGTSRGFSMPWPDDHITSWSR